MRNTRSYHTGGKRFYDDMEDMLGFRINPWVRWCWAFFTPVFCLVREQVGLQYGLFFVTNN